MCWRVLWGESSHQSQGDSKAGDRSTCASSSQNNINSSWYMSYDPSHSLQPHTNSYEPLWRVWYASDAFQYDLSPSDVSRAASRPIVPIRPAVPLPQVPLGTFHTPRAEDTHHCITKEQTYFRYSTALLWHGRYYNNKKRLCVMIYWT
jgi:hypothetical protein